METRIKMLLGVMIVALAVASPTGSALARSHEKDGDSAMMMHHMHMMMNHGLGMVAEGSNLVMIADMRMSPGMDDLTREHGTRMINSGKDLISRSLSGDEMKMMHDKGMGPDKNPAMQDTHDLGEAVLKYADAITRMKMEGMDEKMMDMHHMHVLINHAVEMAAEGSNMMMLGDMKMAGKVDKMSMDHGRGMIADAKAVIGKVTGSKAMTGMHKKGMGPKDDPMMAETHDLIEQALKIIDLLEKM